MPETDKWLVALDIDGTVIHEDETLTEPVREAIGRVRDAGHEVTLATGRSWEMTRVILEALELSPEYVVCANGAITMKKDPDAPTGYRRDLVETFDPGPVLSKIRAGLPDGRFMVEDATGHRLYTEGMNDWNLNNATKVEFDDLAKQPVTRVVAISPNHARDDFIELINNLGLHQVSYAIGFTSWLDIAPDGINKGTALKRIQEIMGFPLNRVFVAGDGLNDIEMFKWVSTAGRAVAMGQASDVVKEVASEVTLDVTEDGLVPALESLLG